MLKKFQFQAIGVLNVKLDMVSFSVLSSTDGREVIAAIKRLPLITNKQANADKCNGEDQIDMDVDTNTGHSSPSSPPPIEYGNVEQDPENIWRAVIMAINEVIDGLSRNGTPITFIKSMSITNEMSTLMVWHSDTGEAIHNAIHWTDLRMTRTCGRTAAAVKWLIQRSTVVSCAGDKCRFGTLDVWLLWKLTNGQKYTTDVTNASYTGLFNFGTMDWDRDECRALGLADCSWPEIRRQTGDHGVIVNGRLRGLMVNAIMANPSAALYGHHCIRHGQTVVMLDVLTSTAIGLYECNGRVQLPENSPTASWPVVGYWEPNKANPVLGMVAVSGANAVVRWLKNSVSLVSSAEECMNMYSTARPAGAHAFLVPAFGGLPTPPYVRTDARFVMCGITESMGREHLIAAAVDSMCYSAADIALCSANGKSIDTVFVEGPYSDYGAVVQRLADVLGARLIRNRCEMATVGVAQMASSVINIKYHTRHEVIVYEPTSSANERLVWSTLWKNATCRSYGWAVENGLINDKFSPSNYCSRVTRTYIDSWIQWLGHWFNF